MPKRKSRSEQLTPGELMELRLRDHLGELTADEIILAKKLGVYRFDGFMKNRRKRKYPDNS